MLAKRKLRIAKRATRELLVDDGDRCRTDPIGVAERSSGNDADTRNTKIIGVGEVEKSKGNIVAGRSGLREDWVPIISAVSGPGRSRDQSYVFYARPGTPGC